MPDAPTDAPTDNALDRLLGSRQDREAPPPPPAPPSEAPPEPTARPEGAAPKKPKARGKPRAKAPKKKRKPDRRNYLGDGLYRHNGRADAKLVAYVPPELKRAVKVRAAERGVTMGVVLAEVLVAAGFGDDDGAGPAPP